LTTTDEIDLVGINKNNVHFSQDGNNAEITIKFGFFTHETIILVGVNDDNLQKETDGHGGTIVYDPPATDASGTPVSLGNDSFIFHNSAGADSGAAKSHDATHEFDHFTAAQIQQWTSFINSNGSGDAFVAHHDDGGAATAHWHAAVHGAFHLS
jgi:hypothetical protein